MKLIPRADAERSKKVQEVILRAMAKSIAGWQAAEILALSPRQMRRWRRTRRSRWQVLFWRRGVNGAVERPGL